MVKITGSEKRLYEVLREANGQLTISEVAEKMGLKTSSVSTTLNTLRKKFAQAGFAFSVNPKVRRGGTHGTTQDLGEFLRSLEGSEVQHVG